MGFKTVRTAIRSMLNECRIRLRALGRLIALFWVLWFGLAVSLMILFLSHMVNHPPGPHNVRYAGMFTQLVGLGCVAWGLNRLQRAIASRTLLGEAKRQLSVFAGRKKSVVVHVKPADLVMEASSPSVTVGSSKPPHEDFGQRLAHLEERIKGLEAKGREQDFKLKRTERALREEVEAERRARDRGDQNVRELVKELSVGGLHIEGMGLVFLAASMVMAGLPEEIAAGIAALEQMLLVVGSL